MNGRVLIGLCTTVEVVCISALAAIGLKRNNDAYKAECELLKSKIDCMFKDAEIKILEKELSDLKEKYEVKEESE